LGSPRTLQKFFQAEQIAGVAGLACDSQYANNGAFEVFGAYTFDQLPTSFIPEVLSSRRGGSPSRPSQFLEFRNLLGSQLPLSIFDFVDVRIVRDLSKF
jgi:hypothetical protein